MTLKGCIRIYLSIAAFLFWGHGQLCLAELKIAAPYSQSIITFTLFTYDNLIADYYEQRSEYRSVLEQLIHDGSPLPTTDIHAVVMTESLYLESHPVRFMLKLNMLLKDKTGVYFEEQ